MRALLKLIVAASLTATLAPYAAPTFAAATQQDFKRMNAEDLDTAMKKETLFIFDSNSEKLYKSGHVPTAKHMPAPAVAANKLPSAKDAKLVFYCANERCTASHEAAKKAMGFGYSNVWVMTDGIQGWEKAGKKVEK